MTNPSAEPTILGRLTRALGPQYEVRGLLGRGGFAEVFEVWDRSLDRRLAVKVLRPDVAWTSGMLARFKQEAKAVAGLTHPNILQIHFVGEAEGIVYYAMPYIEGQSLGDVLRGGGALDPDRALAIARPILDALQHAHEKGLIHRDIKPDNIMIDQASGRPLLVDFGIAKKMEGGQGLTQTGFVVGTPHYMSPEQALGQGDIDARSDLYAMGAVIYQMVTGTPPFEGDSSQEIVAKHITEAPPLATAVDAQIPRWLSEVIVRSLAKKPAERFQSARDMIRALTVGRLSGPQEAIAAAQVAQAVRDQDRTALIPETGPRALASAPTEITVPAAPAPPKRAAAPPAPAAPTPPARSLADDARAGAAPRRGSSAVIVVLVVLLLAGAGAAAWWFFLRPRVLLVNRLAAPIQLMGASGPEQTIGAGAELVVPRPSSGGVRWRLVRPTTSAGAGMGVELSGVAMGGSRGVTRREIVSRAGTEAFFAPLITNATDRPLSVTVNYGLQGSTPCDCSIPAGATRVPIGYYSLYRNSSVRVEDAAGRWAMFSDLGARVDPSSGVVGLRFETKDLRR